MKSEAVAGRERTAGILGANGAGKSSIQSYTAEALRPFGTTVFTEMTQMALRSGAINLAQGAPDFDGPPGLIEAAIEAMKSGENQYAPSMGHETLVQAIACHQKQFYGLEFDPGTEITVFCGATEGIAASLFGLLNPGDEVALIQPFYDSYPPCVAMAHAKARFITLRPPEYMLDPKEVESAIHGRTRVLLLNNPHNPTGKTFSRSELEMIARACARHDVICISDEVYEHITYGEHRHIPIATLPEMRERTLTLSGTGKTFSMTGWKVGWACGPRHLVAAAQAAHQYITFCGSRPLQVAMGHALSNYTGGNLLDLKLEYTERRDLLLKTLLQCGFRAREPQGGYFIVADYSALSDLDDWSFARKLVEKYKVASVPVSVFYHGDAGRGQRRVRFAFCKRMETLRAAAERLLEATRADFA